jgi:hypothetical protein
MGLELEEASIKVPELSLMMMEPTLKGAQLHLTRPVLSEVEGEARLASLGRKSTRRGGIGDWISRAPIPQSAPSFEKNE